VDGDDLVDIDDDLDDEDLDDDGIVVMEEEGGWNRRFVILLGDAGWNALVHCSTSNNDKEILIMGSLGDRVGGILSLLT